MRLFQLLSTFSSVSAVATFAGVNIAGFDFGVDITGTATLDNVEPPLIELGGVDGVGQMQHFAKVDGLNLFRLPVSWQFLINNNVTLGASTNSTNTPFNSTNPSNSTIISITTSPSDATSHSNTASLATANTLDDVNFGKYDLLVRGCLATGAHCIIDVHNYARFNGLIIGQGGPSDAQFASLWSQIATKYANESNIIFGIMNEPHDIPDMTIWAASVQEAVTAIRNAGATTQLILLPGNDFTGAQTFVSNGSAGNLSNVHNLDGSNTSLIFDVHKYLDVDGSGQLLECVSNHINDTFMPLAAFLKENDRQAILSETGGGNSTSCLNDVCQELIFINANDDVYLGYAGWAAGSFSATTYNLTETPFSITAGNTTTFTDQQMVTQCIAGTRQGGGIASKHKRTVVVAGIATEHKKAVRKSM